MIKNLFGIFSRKPRFKESIHDNIKYTLDVKEKNFLFLHEAKDIKGKITINGFNNTVTIGRGARFSGIINVSGSENQVYIGKNSHFRGEILVKEGVKQKVYFGDNSTTVNVYILCQEGCDVRIGKWCMFSREIEIRTTDAHSVIDRETGRRLNMPASVEIGDHVWVGLGAIINKGVKIADDNIVGAMSFVSKSFEESGTVIAGVPARVLKTGITWSRSRKSAFKPHEMKYWQS